MVCFFRRPQSTPSDPREESVQIFARSLYARVTATCGRVATSIATFFSVSAMLVVTHVTRDQFANGFQHSCMVLVEISRCAA